MPSGLFYLNSLDLSNSNRENAWLFLLLPCFIEISVVNANSVHPDQTPRSAASDLVYTVCQFPLWDARKNELKYIYSLLCKKPSSSHTWTAKNKAYQQHSCTPCSSSQQLSERTYCANSRNAR